jgi:hypothetical protein
MKEARDNMATPYGAPVVTQFRDQYARVRAHASWGLTPAELFPAPALSCCYLRTPRLRPRASRAAAMKLAPPFSRLNSHAARLTLPRASPTSRPPLSAKCQRALLGTLVLTP